MTEDWYQDNNFSVGEPLKGDGSSLTYIQKGVLYVEKNPFYIIELVKEPSYTYVLVYAVHPGTESNPKKLAKQKEVVNQQFRSTTRLGKLASKLKPTKKHVKLVPEPPLFVAPVIPNQYATFTGKYESGFYEREEDKWTVVGGELVMERGKNTGVFIGLSSIVWEEKISIPTESILRELNKAQSSDTFFDLQGDNSDESNPLSSVYKEQ